MFIVLSGYTCSKSLSKAESVRDFYKKRFFSLAFGFYTMLVAVVTANIICESVIHRPFVGSGNTEILSVLCNALLIHGLLPFCNNNVFPGGWFIGTIVLLYLIHPLIDHIYQRTKKRGFVTILGISICFLVTEIVNWFMTGSLKVDNNSFQYFLFTNQ